VNGPEGAGSLCLSVLQAHLPTKITELEARLSLAAGAIGQPGLITSDDRPASSLELSAYPGVIVDTRRLLSIEMSDQSVTGTGPPSAGREYLCRYQMRVWFWVRDQEYGGVTAKRDRYALAIREVLLQNEAWSGLDAFINEDSITESYSDVAEVEEGDMRQLAGAFVDFSATMTEVLSVPVLGTVESVQPSVGMLVDHPGLL
jgi:hypothetical protein